ncbi:MAG: glycosyltransferase family 9 protein [Candidatus Binatia bacterium]
MRVLTVLHGALGDVIRALPLLGRLRRGLPDAQLAWAVEPASAPVLRGHPWIDRLHVFARERGPTAFVPFVREIRAARYDVAIDLGRSAKTAAVALASGAPVRLGFAAADGREGGWLVATRRLPVQGAERPKLEQFLAFGDLLGLPPVPVDFGLVPSDAERGQAAALTAGLPRPLIAACVGSSCPSRRWYAERMAATLDALAVRRGTGAVLLGTAADAPFAAEVMRRTRTPVRDLVGRTSLRQLLAVLAETRLALGPDSGALHLAAALGRPVVSLWGATSPLRSAPYGSERRVVCGSAPCVPCFLKHCPIGRVCMQAIGVETVVARSEEALAA